MHDESLDSRLESNSGPSMFSAIWLVAELNGVVAATSPSNFMWCPSVIACH